MISSNNVLDSLVNSADVKNTLDSLVVPSNSPAKARLPPTFSVSFKNRLIIRCSNKWHVSWSAGKEYAGMQVVDHEFIISVWKLV